MGKAVVVIGTCFILALGLLLTLFTKPETKCKDGVLYMLYGNVYAETKYSCLDEMPEDTSTGWAHRVDGSVCLVANGRRLWCSRAMGE